MRGEHSPTWRTGDEGDIDDPTKTWHAPRQRDSAPTVPPPPVKDRPEGVPVARPYVVGDSTAPHLARDRWARIALDRSVAEPEPRPPSCGPYRPDTVFDGWSTEEFTVRLASVRGQRHRDQGAPRQDDVAVTVHTPTDSIVFAVADGATDADRSHIGAAVACRSAIAGAMAALDGGTSIDWRTIFERVASDLVARAGRLPGAGTADPALLATQHLATALVAGVLTPTAKLPRLSLAHVGDPAVWLLRRQRYERLTQVAASGTLPRQRERVYRVERSLPADATLLVGSGGFVEPMDDGAGPVGELFRWLFGMSPAALAVAHVLDFGQERYNDDRTLLAIAPNRARSRVTDPRGRADSGWSAWQSG